MNKMYSELLAPLPVKHQALILALLNSVDTESWYNAKHLIVCSNPLLTLEMAVNRINDRERNDLPTCEDIQQALSYADQKRISSKKQKSEKISELSSNNAA